MNLNSDRIMFTVKIRVGKSFMLHVSIPIAFAVAMITVLMNFFK